MSDKRHLRREMLLLRRNQSAEQNALLSSQIAQKLWELGCVQDASCIMAYYPHKGEIDLRGFLKDSINAGKCVALPHIVRHGVMVAVRYDLDSVMIHNRHGIFEPEERVVIAPAQIDVVIVPALALGEDLHRIGYGGGYYDRFLKKTHALKIGVGFDTQIVSHLPRHSHDVPLDLIVSEKRMIGELPCG